MIHTLQPYSELKLVFPTDEYAEDWKNYLQALTLADPKIIPGNLLADSFELFLKNITNFKNGILPNEYYVPSLLLFLINSNDPSIILGAIDLRLDSNETVLNKVGHIGISVHPSVRGHGIGKHMLQQGLCVLSSYGIKEATYICDKRNIGSRGLAESFHPLEQTSFLSDGVEKYKYILPITQSQSGCL